MGDVKTAGAKSGKTGKGKKREISTASKAALGILIVGFIAGTALAVCMDRIMKKIFVNEEWPNEEWSADDWAEEDLEG